MIHTAVPIAIAALLPYVFTLISKSKGFGKEENKQTRLWQAKLEGWQQRAFWAHQNGFEAFPIFASLAILAYIAQPNHAVAAVAAWVFVVLRVLYGVCYLANLGGLRTLVWMCSQASLIAFLLVIFRVI